MGDAEKHLVQVRAVPLFEGTADTDSLPWTTGRGATLRLFEESGQQWTAEVLGSMFRSLVCDVLRTDERVDRVMMIDMTMDVKPKKIGKLPLDRGGTGIVVFTEQRLVAGCAYDRRGKKVRDVQSVPLNGSIECNIAAFNVRSGLVAVVDLPLREGLLRFVPSEEALGRDTFELWVSTIRDRVAGTFGPKWADGVLEGWGPIL